MYCPKCLNETLFIKPKGVIDIFINGKKRDNGRFLYNIQESEKEQLVADFKLKCEEFFKWYSQFNNQDPIEYVELLTVDVKCENSCKFSPLERFSAVDIIVKRSLIEEILTELGEKYKMRIALKV